jgi:CBS domain-containing protein
VSAVIAYLAYINVILAVFNMLPAFPLDGGRVLRSALWAWKKDLRTATRWASRFGSGLAVALIGLGLLSIFMGQVVGGIWYLIIGMFLRAAAHGSYRRVLVRQALSGERVGNLMMREPVSVSPDMSVRELVDGYFNRYHFKMFPVLENGGRLAGCVTSRQVREVDREEWDRRTVGDIVDACSTENTARPQEDAMDAFQRMQQSGNSRLLVVEGERLRGVIALKDLMGHMSSRMDAQGRQELQT